MKNSIIVGIVALLIGGIVGWFIHKPETKFLAGEVKIEYRDTCILNNIIADVTTETTTKETGGIKKGSSTKEISTFPVEQVSVQDTDVVTVFSKSYNTGLMRMKVTTTVKAKSAATGKIEMSYELDTMTLNSMTTVVNTVVVAKDTVDKVPDVIVKYFEIPYTKKMTYLGIGGLITKNPKQYNYAAGLSLSHGKTSVSLFKDFTQPIKSLDGFSIGINRQLFRLSQK